MPSAAAAIARCDGRGDEWRLADVAFVLSRGNRLCRRSPFCEISTSLSPDRFGILRLKGYIDMLQAAFQPILLKTPYVSPRDYHSKADLGSYESSLATPQGVRATGANEYLYYNHRLLLLSPSSTVRSGMGLCLLRMPSAAESVCLMAGWRYLDMDRPGCSTRFSGVNSCRYLS